MKNKSTLLLFIFVAVISFGTIFPLFSNGFFPMHDDTQVARVYEMGNALQDGQFPVRWVENLGYGYGYPIFNFYAPLSYYVGGFFEVIGFNALVSTKIMMGIGMIIAGVGMFLFVNLLWGKYSATVASILYMYAPYHAINLYVRGAVGELWAYGFVPFAFYGCYRIFKSPTIYSSLIFAISFSAIILSHNLTALIITPFLLLFALILCFIKFKEKKVYILTFTGIVIGLGLSAFYWLPIPFEMHYTNVYSQVGGGADYRDHFVCLNQFWNSQWGFGGSTPSCIDGLSFRIGKIYILLAVISVLVSIIFIRNKKEKLNLFLFYLFCVFFVISFLMATNYSFIVWANIKQLEFIQYPWRYLGAMAFFISLVGGGLLLWIQIIFKNNNKYYLYIVTFLIVGLTCFYNFKLFTPQTLLSESADSYVSKYAIQWDASKTSDEYMPEGFKKPLSEKDIPNEIFIKQSEIKVSNISKNSNVINANINANTSSSVVVNLASFPMWEFYSNGEKIVPKVKNGIYELPLSNGMQSIRIQLKQTPIQQIGNTISIISILFIIIAIIYTRKRHIYHEKT